MAVVELEQHHILQEHHHQEAAHGGQRARLALGFIGTALGNHLADHQIKHGAGGDPKGVWQDGAEGDHRQIGGGRRQRLRDAREDRPPDTFPPADTHRSQRQRHGDTLGDIMNRDRNGDQQT